MPNWDVIQDKFQKNQFFTVTALSGWSYVYNAKSRIELIFWYLVIGVFMGLTFYNVCQLVLYYAAQEIQFRVVLASSNKEIEIPDIKLILDIPILELWGALPSAISHTNCVPTTNKNYRHHPFLVLFDYMCLHDPDDASSTGTQGMYQNQLLSEMTRDLEHKFNNRPFDEMIKLSHKTNKEATRLNNDGILRKWQKEFNRANSSLIQVLHQALATDVRGLADACDVMEDIYVASNAPLAARSNDTLLKLILLQAVQTGRDPRTSFVQPEKPANNFLQKIDTHGLFGDVLKDLSKVVHISTEPQVSLFLRNWTLADTTSTATAQQILTFSLLPPRKTQNLEIKIYSYVFMWLHYLLSTWDRVIKFQLENGSLGDLSSCATNGQYLADQLLAFGQAYRNKFYEVPETVTVQLPDDTRVVLPAGIGHTVTLLPTIIFNSNLDDCFNISIQECIDKCVIESHIQQCNCTPWTMSPYISPSTSLCAIPCPSATSSEDCAKTCAESMSHPCHLLSARTNVNVRNAAEFTGFLSNNVFEFFSVTLRFPEGRHYMRAIAEHEMSRNKFLSLLGGSIELWGVFSITALIHACAYILLQYIYSRIELKDDAMDLTVEREQLEEAVQALKDSIEKEKENSWWRRFKTSSFYQETPMIGYIYIAAATSIVEVAFWISMILIFGTFAAVNVYNTLDRFASNPTHITMTPIMYEEALLIPNLTMQLNLPLCELTSEKFGIEKMIDTNKFYTIEELGIIWDRLRVHMLGLHEGSANVTNEELRLALMSHLSAQLLAKPSLSFGAQKETPKDTLFNEVGHKQWKNVQDEIFQELKQVIIDSSTPNYYSAIQLQQVVTKILLKPFQYGQRDELFLKSMLLDGIEDGHLVFDHIELNSTQISDKIRKLSGATRALLASTVASLGQLFHVQTSSPSQILLTDISVSPWYLTLELQINIDANVGELEFKINSRMFDWISHILYDGSMELISLFQGPSFNERAYLVVQFTVILFQELRAWFLWAGHAQLRTHHSQPFHIYLNAQGGQVQIPITTNWQLTSKTSSCKQEDNYAMCLADCLLEEHLSLCDCIPWHMKHLARGQKLCSTSCVGVDDEHCDSICSFKLCELRSIEFGPSEVTQTRNTDNMLQFRLYTKQQLHMKLIEQYDLTMGALIGELGGVSDFWLGLNLFAILHATVHAIKLCIKYRKKMGSRGATNTQRMKLKLWRKKRVEATELLEQIENSMGVLRGAASSNKLVTYDKRARFSWLRRNKFFADTPLSIFPFINLARTRAEVLLWYLAIFGFCIHTSINVFASVKHYRSKPTKIEAHFSHDQIVPMANFSLTFNVPILELSNADPTHLHVKDMAQWRVDKKPVSMVDFMFCGLTDTYDSSHYDLEFFMTDWLRSNNWKLAPLSSALNSDLSSNRTLEHWHSIFKVASENLALFMSKNQHVIVEDTSHEELDALREQFLELLTAPMLRFTAAYVPFFILDAFKSGGHPQEEIVEKLKQVTFEHAEKVHRFENKMAIELILNGQTPLEIYQLAQHYLTMQLHVDIRGVDNAKVFLQDWNFQPGSKHDWSHWQNIVLTVLFPANNRATRVDVEVRSFSQVWNSYILSTLHQHYHSRNHSLCMGYDLKNMLDIQYGKYIREWWYGSGQLIVRPDDRNDLRVNQFQRQTPREFQSIMTLTSKTDNCVPESFESCFAVCESDAYLKQFGCIPWRLVYLEHRAVCTEPYALPLVTTRNCDEKCELKLLHPCHMGIYKVTPLLEHQTWNLEDFDFELPIYSFSIDKPKTKHIKYTETYDLSLGSLIGELGGLLDLYMGLNILAVVHLIAYMAKHCLSFVATKRKSKAKLSPSKADNAANDQEEINLLEKKLKKELKSVTKEIEEQLLKWRPRNIR